MSISETEKQSVTAVTDQDAKKDKALLHELALLRRTVLVSAILVLGGLVAVVVYSSGADWFVPTIVYFVISYVAWERLA